MATAPQPASPVEPTTARDPRHVSLEFVVFQDNGGSHRWRLISPGGSALARSGSFASRSEAERAAQHVIENAHSARLVAAGDEDRQVAFTHSGSVDSEDLSTPGPGVTGTLLKLGQTGR